VRCVRLSIIHIRGFITPDFLLLMFLVALTIFQSWIRVGVGIGKLLIVLGFRNFFNTKITFSGSLLGSGLVSVSLHYNNGLNVVTD
jgi:hypothetical protein